MIGFVVQKRHKSYLFLKKLLGYKPNNYSLYRLALRHGSSSLKGANGTLINNERLEFLGDAALNLVISDYLYKQYEQEQEGFLTKQRSAIVKRESLNAISQYFGLNKLLIAEKSVKNQNDTHIMGSAFEALIGAIYLDMGFEVCRSFIVDKVISAYRELEESIAETHNYKSLLFEWCQHRHLDLEFKLIEELKADNNKKIFTTQVFIDQKPYATGKGKSKKESHQEAARLSLSILENN